METKKIYQITEEQFVDHDCKVLTCSVCAKYFEERGRGDMVEDNYRSIIDLGD